MSGRRQIDFVTEGSGDTIIDTAGEALGKHKLVYLSASSDWRLADADSVTTMPVIGLTLEAIAAGQKGTILLRGYVADPAWSWTLGGSSAEIYASQTAGELTQTAPLNNAQVVAVARTATGILFSDGLGSVGAIQDPEHTADYIVWVDGGVYYAKDGHSGQVTSNINATILILDAATNLSGGGIIHLKTGTYTLTSGGQYCLDLPSNIWLRGNGKSTILTTSTSGAYIISIRNSKSNIVISDLMVDGALGGVVNGAGIYVYDSDYITIRNVWTTRNGVTGLLATAVDGVLIDKTSTYIKIENVISWANGRHGIALVDSDFNDVINCRTYDNSLGHGILVNGADYNFVNKNRSYNNGNSDDAILLEVGATGNIVSENYCFSNTRHGITLSASMYNKIINNKIYLNNQLGVSVSGIGVGNEIYGNDIYSNTYQGIQLNSNGSIVKHNYIRENGRHGIDIFDGSSNVVTDNYLFGNSQNTDNAYDNIILQSNSDNNVLRQNHISPSALANKPRYGINVSANTCNTNIIQNNDIVSGYSTGPLQDLGVGSDIKLNEGFVTESTVSATIASGATSVVVNHGLSYTPSAADTEISVMYLEVPTNNPGPWSVDTFTATQCTIRVMSDPGASNLDIQVHFRRNP